ncbi:MAG: L-glutamate gamma-semialdehyde dehydrogenase [Bacteroidota bacterium]|nr:L-glutamate gamma-semialdehyde dehydrogenase [Rhodothermia bacterium]MDW8285836.1 L-glutamate gamma-semialdehyde dehydrogenase [Bacteroidota bacterium]
MGLYKIPRPTNEPVRSYAPGTPERTSLRRRIEQMRSEVIEIPVIVAGEELYTGQVQEVVCPHEHGHVLARFHQAGPREVELALEAAKHAWQEWSRWPWEERAAIFLKAADLLAGPWRDTLNAATILGQSKNVFQAEIDAACELVDFFRFNVYYMQFIYEQQPDSAPGMWNRMEYRPLEGFIFAVTPFNFTSIGGNLPTAPALMGNTVLWKPASTALYSNYYVYRLLEAAGLPPGVINFLPGSGPQIGALVLSHPDLAGVHFTGSTNTFRYMWKLVGEHIERYRTYPRLVGETGGKDFIVVHPSADLEAAATAIVRGGYEYQGQKCSAASRIYAPKSRWPKLKELLLGQLAEIRMGPPEDFRNFFNAVIDRAAFRNIVGYIEYARRSAEAQILYGGTYDDTTGYYIAPTLIETADPGSRLMCEEIFGPVVSVYVYPDDQYADTLRIVDQTSPYGLTGSIFAQDRKAIQLATELLRYAAGNFYINDKPTGAVVGQQPFGGSRASGTNDKAGSYLNLLRWITPRAIKETFLPPRHFAYPFMQEDPAELPQAATSAG